MPSKFEKTISKASQLPLGIQHDEQTMAFACRGIFSLNYLQQHFAKSDGFPTLEDARPIYERLKKRWLEDYIGLCKRKEAYTRTQFLDPLLNEIGWTFIPEQDLPSKGVTRIPLGWDWNEDENIASVFHNERNKRIAVCNTDKGTGLRNYHPQPIIQKGDGVKRAVFTNEYVFQGILDSTLNPPSRAGSFWYVCIFSDGDIVRAELCCPILNESGSFKDFHKRVILIGDDDADGGVRLRREIPGPDSDAGFEINVVRKQA